MKYLKINEVSKLLGISSATLRRWDKNGKFNSKRHPINNYRVYSDEQVKSLVKEMQYEIYPTEKETVKYVPAENKKILHSTEFGELFSLDVLDFLNQLEDDSIDLIFADPPYNINKAEWDTFDSQKKYVEWSMSWIKLAEKKLTKKGSLYICGFSEILADLKWAASYLFKGCKWLVWFYRNKANLGNDWGRSHESILHFRKSKDFIFNLNSVRIPYNEHTLKYPVRPQAETSQYNNGNGKKYLWEPNPLGAKPKDVFEIPTISNGSWEKTLHPTQKPLELIKRIVLSSSNENSIIVDPFGGSGTTYMVCEAYKRNWIGNEVNKEYCQIIVKRLRNKSQLEKIKNPKEEIAAYVRRKKLRSNSN